MPQLHAWLHSEGLCMASWVYRAFYEPEFTPLVNSPHLKRLKLLPDAERHAAVELFRGDIAMHSLVACRDDRPAENYQVSFDGQAWKG